MANNNNLDDYKNMKKNANSARSYLGKVSSALRQASEYFEDGVIINGRPYDNGVLNEILNQLEDIDDKLTIIYNRCENKINDISNSVAVSDGGNSIKKPSKNSSVTSSNK